MVKSGVCRRALVQLSYAVGVAKPSSLFVETYGAEQGDLIADDITNVIKIAFDCHPGAIAQSLTFREPKYQETSHIATSAGSHTPQRAGSISSGRTPRICPGMHPGIQRRSLLNGKTALPHEVTETRSATLR